ncbi:MAG: acyl-ACP--UDP-N-acetylglucosamine O-acyltransferase [Prevotellaceae bacterium]|jgi:UDP-N-acetylglucosamine acyltransferase|nr:acyl-ACP--UDP-N-acetylglucosamine O-acyltransferase [Prevotellaceae bacterium]
MNLSQIHPNATLGNNVTVDAFTTIAAQVEIGEGTWIGPNVTIMDYVKIGKNCRIFPGAVIGAIPQDLKFQGEITHVEIGDNTMIRECATVNRGTAHSGKGTTRIGNDCLIMAYVHVAHDCHIHNNVILVSFVGLAGEVEVDDFAIIGGSSAAHQYTRVGQHAMLSGGSVFGKDVPPYILAGHRPLSFGGINIIGLRRRGFSNEKIQEISNIYKIIYGSKFNTTDACHKIEETFPPTPERDQILAFIRSTKRGIIKRAVLSLDEE